VLNLRKAFKAIQDESSPVVRGGVLNMVGPNGCEYLAVHEEAQRLRSVTRHVVSLLEIENSGGWCKGQARRKKRIQNSVKAGLSESREIHKAYTGGGEG
jgi:hypothetical protein